jgi:hypothetical protein
MLKKDDLTDSLKPVMVYDMTRDVRSCVTFLCSKFEQKGLDKKKGGDLYKAYSALRSGRL